MRARVSGADVRRARPMRDQMERHEQEVGAVVAIAR